MKKLVMAALVAAGFGAKAQVDADKASLIKSIYTEALGAQQGYEWLKYMCEEIGPRPSGSEAANEAAHWAKVVMMEAGADTAWLQEVEVPKWYRGDEWSKAYSGGEPIPLPTTALGGSVPTPKEGVSLNSYVSDKDLDKAYECASVKPKTLVLSESTSVRKGSDKDARSSNDTASVKLLTKLTTLLRDSEIVGVSVLPKS